MTFAEVMLWDRKIGTVALPDDGNIATFRYDRDFLGSGIELSPVTMPLSARQYSFAGLPYATFHGLPGLLADSLPDRFGNTIIDQWLARQGRDPSSFNAVERLCYTGKRGMGALEFRPALGPGYDRNDRIRVNELVRLASDILNRRSDMHVQADDSAMRQILQIGTSAGGARAKAIIAWNPETNDIRSGQIEAGQGYEYWLIKFDGVSKNGDHDLKDPPVYTRIEYAYYLMAKAAGINMSECRLFEENGLIQRLDTYVWQETARQMNIVLAVAVVLTILVIILMARNIMIRRRSRQRLLAKNEELRKANAKVMAADEMKTQFIRNVSHEIRTPLNIINGFAQVLTNEENTFEPAERHQIAEAVSTNTRQITSLVNKMLALANQNTEDLLKEVEETDALDICHKALQEMPSVDPERIKVELEDLTYGRGTTLCTNSDSLLQMLDNILENAVKFTEKGTIRLTLRNDGKMMWFTVEDTGCGIPEDKISTIFDRFMKVDEFKEGLGLGLAYCYETTKRLGGVLRLDHTSEAGTSFTLGLPLKVKK